MNRTRRILSGLGLALLLGTTLPACLVTARGRFATGAVVAYDQPPPPRDEAPQMMSGHVWVKGNWNWQNGQWVWVDGHVERERAGYAWSDGRWEPHNGSWHWVEGEWSVSTSGSVVVDGGGRPLNQDHRQDGAYGNGGVVVNNVPTGAVGGVVVNNGGAYGNSGAYGNGGVVVNNGSGGIIASNGAGTVISTGSGVVIVGPTAPPPPIRVENAGPARRGYVWIEGTYNWTANNNYDWVPGHWERTKANQTWQPVRWELRGNVYVRIGGEWHIN